MWPDKVGIHAIELLVPSRYVDQTALERFDAVSEGKYRLGLGQTRMGFCTDREDIHSLCLTVVHNLLQRHNLKPSDIGRLEVGTETLIDKSKSVKSVLMQLFESSHVTDLEGVDSTNACYGGTAALFNAISWIESSYWDGRYALVVCADIAVYAKGPARPTGGAGAVAMLLSSQAPLVFDRGLRATYMKHAYDFYKPDLSSEYPTVDGPLSIQCYLNALDECYQLYKRKHLKTADGQAFTLATADAFMFHTPYCKLVQKSLARLAFNDYLSDPSLYPTITSKATLEGSYFDKTLEKTFLDASNATFNKKTRPSLLVASEVGNMYTPSLYGGLVSWLIQHTPQELAGTKLCLFSYGSGLAASMFSATLDKDADKVRKLTEPLAYVRKTLQARLEVPPERFTEALEIRERSGHSAPYKPLADIGDLFPGTYYLESVDEKHRRAYKRVPDVANGTHAQ